MNTDFTSHSDNFIAEAIVHQKCVKENGINSMKNISRLENQATFPDSPTYLHQAKQIRSHNKLAIFN